MTNVSYSFISYELTSYKANGLGAFSVGQRPTTFTRRGVETRYALSPLLTEWPPINHIDVLGEKRRQGMSCLYRLMCRPLALSYLHALPLCRLPCASSACTRYTPCGRAASTSATRPDVLHTRLPVMV